MKADASIVKEVGELSLAPNQTFFCFATLSYVSKYKYDAVDNGVLVSDWGCAVVDRTFRAVPSDQERMVREPNDLSSTKNLLDWVL